MLLAVASVPRAVFMLVGGAVTDRYSAKTLLIASNGVQAVIMAVLGFGVITSFTHLWFLYVLSFLAGFIDAFGLPAFSALLPQIVEDDELESGNVYLQGANMASGVIGPALAGLLISLVGTHLFPQANLNGIGFAFLIDALTYFIGISFFWWIRIGDDLKASEVFDESLVTSIRHVIAFVREDIQLRYLFGLMMVLGLFLTGTIRVGFPLLADTNLSGGVRDFGYMSSAFGGGMLTGMIAIKLLPKPPQAISGVVLLTVFAFLPGGLILLGFAPPIGASLVVIFVMGTAFGYVNITLLSWLQRRTPTHLLGRVMAVVLFSTIGLSPVSQALMGYLLDLNIRVSLVGVGSLVLVLLVVTGTNREMWGLKDKLTFPTSSER
jgi:MFS family permease